MSAVRFPGSRESLKAVRRVVDQQPSDDNASVRSRAAARIIVPHYVNPICAAFRPYLGSLGMYRSEICIYFVDSVFTI